MDKAKKRKQIEGLKLEEVRGKAKRRKKRARVLSRNTKKGLTLIALRS